ncbi:MAG: glycosyltransferase family 4 protein [Rhodocyclaceae bacterium]|nr:glycosyltransferase family 4 protein [Rhodocyclaceae bacterium]
MPTALHIHFWADIRNTAGSVEKVILSLATHGRAYSHAVACCPPQAISRDFYRHRNVDVYAFHENHLRNRILNKMFRLDAFTYPSLIATIEELRPDILHFHNRQELVDAVIERLSYRPGVAVHYHRHFAQPIVPRSADILLTVSRATESHILSKTGTATKCCVLYNPLSQELLEIAGAAPLPEPHNTSPLFLFGGGGGHHKGGRELIEAFQRLPLGTARLALAGNFGTESGSLASGIEIMGILPVSRFLGLMKDSDIVVMPSRDESFGLIAQEAMFLGRPLIATKIGGLGEFVDDECAIIVEPGNVESLYLGMLSALAMLKDDVRRSVMLVSARKKVERFAPENIVAQLEKFYDECLQ